MTQPLYGNAPTSYSIKRHRQLADALLSNATDASPKGHWTQALAQGLNGFMAGRENRLANEEEGQRSQALANALGGNMSPADLENFGAVNDMPELVDMGQSRRRDENWQKDFEADQAYRGQQQQNWQQGFNADEAWRTAQRNEKPSPGVGYRWTPEGNQEFIPGGQADPNKPVPARSLRPTTDQANAAGFYDRMNASNQILSDPNVTQAAMSFGQGLMNQMPMGIGNYMTSPEYQQYDQASRDFVNAILRKESGAAISPSEFENARIQYFPQPGDTPEKIAQKQKNREIVINAMHRTAGPALSAQPAQAEPASMDFGEVGQIPEGAVVEDEQGARYRKENGTLVPVQ